MQVRSLLLRKVDKCCINGPVIIGKEAEVRHCAFIRGKAIIGEGAVVGNSTELKNAVLFNKVQVPHYNYVGDAVLGYKSHMGAGSICSNVKSDKKLVVVKGRFLKYVFYWFYPVHIIILVILRKLLFHM